MTQAQSPGDLTEVKTLSGCIAFANKDFQVIAKLPGFTVTFEWDGACVGGMAQGMGTLTQKNESKNGATQQVLRQRFQAGYGMGYGKLSVEFKGMNGPERHDAWIYSFVDRYVIFNNMGLGTRDDLLSSSRVILPTQGVQYMLSAGNLNSAQGNVSFFKANCALFAEQFMECGFGADQPQYQVPVMQAIPKGMPPLEAFKNQKNTFCPNPKIFDAACAELMFKQTASQRREIIGFIESTSAAVEAVIKKIDAAQ